MLQCEYCSKKLYDINPHKWTEYNIKQHKKYCKLKPIAKSKFSIDNFFAAKRKIVEDTVELIDSASSSSSQQSVSPSGSNFPPVLLSSQPSTFEGRSNSPFFSPAKKPFTSEALNLVLSRCPGYAVNINMKLQVKNFESTVESTYKKLEGIFKIV